MDEALTILLVDDHPLFHEGLASMLRAARPSSRLLSAYDADQGLALARQSPDLDLVLIDIMLPGADGFDALASFGAEFPMVARVLISGREDAIARVRARQGGASGFISKAWPPARIVEVVDAVLAGGSGFDTVGSVPSDPGEPFLTLTPRQLEVLGLLAEGQSNKAIEFKLGIAERTVRAHLTELFHALGAQTRMQALLRAQRLGLIP